MDGSVLVSQTEEIVTARHWTEGEGISGRLRVEVGSIKVGCDGLIVTISRKGEGQPVPGPVCSGVGWAAHPAACWSGCSDN